MDRAMRQEIVADLRSLLAPDRAIGDSVIPPVAFFTTNAILGLRWAAVVGLAVGVGVGAWRITRGHRVAAAIYGFVAVAVSVAAALSTDRAAGYVLPAIVMSLVLAVGTAVSVFLRRPMTAWVSRFVRGWPASWYWRNDVRPAYSHVSWYWFVFYLARAASVWVAYEWASLGVVLVVRVLVGWPTILPLVIVSYVRGNRLLHELGGPTVREHIAISHPPFGRQRGF